MNKPENNKLKLLLVEDVESDALLAKRQLKKAGFDLETKVVWEADAYREALEKFSPDVVLSDYSLPQFNALEALRILKDQSGDIPFLLYTGTQSEEVAVECLRAGADDYLLKSSLTRLPEAIKNALESRRTKQREARAIAALKNSEESFRALIENSPDSVAVLRGPTIVYVNPSFRQYIDINSEGLLGTPFGDLIHAEDRESFEALLSESGKGSFHEEELRYKRSDGASMVGESSVIPIAFHGEPGTAVVVRDVTEKREMQARLLLSDRLASLGTLAAGVAHEINNPLGYMITNLESIDEDLHASLQMVTDLMNSAERKKELEPVHATLEDLKEPVQIARRGADRVRNIVGDLMMFARSDHETQEYLELNAVIEFTLKMAAAEIKRKATLELDLKPVSPVIANESRLGQVFLNLVINALQALPDRPPSENKIRVATYMVGNSIVAEVSDNGKGIPQRLQGRIFDPFFTTKPVGVGTGLGLSICHSLVTASGGTIDVESAEGKGTTFRVRFHALSGA